MSANHQKKVVQKSYLKIPIKAPFVNFLKSIKWNHAQKWIFIFELHKNYAIYLYA